jgi:hypothetical protein
MTVHDDLHRRVQPASAKASAVRRSFSEGGRDPAYVLWRRRLAPAGIAALVLVVGAILALPALTRHSNTVLAAQLAADHVKCFKVFADPSVTAQAGDVERLLSDFGWEMRVPDSSPDHGLRLLGGRWCLYAHGTIPHVLYEAGDQQVSLFRLEGSGLAPGEVTVFGHRALVWQRGGHTFVLIGSEKAGPTLSAISRYIEQEAR